MEARKRSRQALSAPMAEREEKSLTRDKTILLGVCKKELHHLSNLPLLMSLVCLTNRQAGVTSKTGGRSCRPLSQSYCCEVPRSFASFTFLSFIYRDQSAKLQWLPNLCIVYYERSLLTAFTLLNWVQFSSPQMHACIHISSRESTASIETIANWLMYTNDCTCIMAVCTLFYLY